jgi:hypothetical protein
MLSARSLQAGARNEFCRLPFLNLLINPLAILGRAKSS